MSTYTTTSLLCTAVLRSATTTAARHHLIPPVYSPLSSSPSPHLPRSSHSSQTTGIHLSSLSPIRPRPFSDPPWLPRSNTAVLAPAAPAAVPSPTPIEFQRVLRDRIRVPRQHQRRKINAMMNHGSRSHPSRLPRPSPPSVTRSLRPVYESAASRTHPEEDVCNTITTSQCNNIL